MLPCTVSCLRSSSRLLSSAAVTLSCTLLTICLSGHSWLIADGLFLHKCRLALFGRVLITEFRANPNMWSGKAAQLVTTGWLPGHRPASQSPLHDKTPALVKVDMHVCLHHCSLDEVVGGARPISICQVQPAHCQGLVLLLSFLNDGEELHVVLSAPGTPSTKAFCTVVFR